MCKHNPALSAWDAAPLGFVGAISTPGTWARVIQAAVGIRWHLPAEEQGSSKSPASPTVSKTCFSSASLIVFIFITALCYNNTPQHIHGTFNHSEAWDNLERKLNIINFYFRGKEIKTQEKGPAQDELQKSQTHVGLPASAVSCLQDLIYAKGIFESVLSQLRVIFFLQHHTSQARTKILWHSLSLNLRA